MSSNSCGAQDVHDDCNYYVRGTKLDNMEHSSDELLDTEEVGEKLHVPHVPPPASSTEVPRGNGRTKSLDGTVLKFKNITFVAGKGKKRKTIIENVSAEVTDGREFTILQILL